jgi:pyruvate carboxylase
MIAGGASL